ncbi:unnamed protein product [Rotaria socialis]|uniref:RING-type domain-containing protein n=1 Tax=Rotaria socialis TaxID=392032 RepID=A0A818A5F6_9BILA|nr:unnamed protein product [Rotaria socialis]
MKIADFEYLDSDSIDVELKCAICIEPFDSPVCATKCGHTFCQECIQESLKEYSKCPTCRQHVTLEDYTPVKTRALINQLARLLVKRNFCEQTNIDDRKKHTEICTKKIVPCLSADHKCQWSGRREELSLHLTTCPFQQIRPIIDQLINESKTIREAQTEQQRFIQAFINNGYTLSRICTTSPCHLKNPPIPNEAHEMPCSLCNQQTETEEIGLHSCDTVTCICKSCLNQHVSHSSRSSRKRKLSVLEHVNNEESESDDDQNDNFIIDMD